MDFRSWTMSPRPMSSKNRRRYVRNLVELPFSQWNYIAWRTSSSSLSRCRFVLSHLLCHLCGLCRLLSCALPDLLHALYSCISQLQISRLSRWNRNDRWIKPHYSAIRSKIGVSRATRWRQDRWSGPRLWLWKRLGYGSWWRIGTRIWIWARPWSWTWLRSRSWWDYIRDRRCRF